MTDKAVRSIRDYLTPEERALPLEQTVDPGFVHKRKIQTIMGPSGMSVVDSMVARIPATLPEWQMTVRIDHVYKDVFLEFCKIHGIKTLGEVMAAERGHMICSTETFAPCKNIYDVDRATSVWVPKRKYGRRVEFRYSTNLVASDTLRSVLYQGGQISVIAELHKATENLLVFHPILMGFPWLRSNDPEWQDKVMWWNHDFFENFVEDFDEFSQVRTIDKPADFLPMKDISEHAFKKALAQILGDSTGVDWGGETSDHFTSHIHLKGHRVAAAFLLKGPARFAPMALNHLGKNNDQIVRLAKEPADVLIVQHCHQITPAVRATLRAFAVQPYGARRYCLIDGRDSLWLLQAYGLHETALGWSKVASSG
jgi:hypothetical protein